jgi:tetratricopeptide (TPR) repeat protein
MKNLRGWLFSILALGLIAGLGMVLSHSRPQAPKEILAPLGPSPDDLRAVEQAAREHPDDGPTQLRLASARLAVGDPIGARAALRSATRSPKTAVAASQGLRQAALQDSDWGVAIPDFEEALVKGQRDPITWRNYIEALVRSGKLPEAQAALAEARDHFHTPGGFALQEAQLQAASGHNLKAADLYEAGLKQQPDPGSQLEYALLLARMSGREKARLAFQKAVELDPASGLAYLGLAKVSLELSRVDEAVDAAFTALKMTPQSPEAMYVLGRALMEKGQSEDVRTSRELFDRVLKADPGHLDARYARGVVKLRMGEAKGAVEDLEDVVVRQPQRLDARQGLVRALQAAGDPRAREQQQALTELSALDQRRSELVARVARSPHNAELRCDLADFFVSHGAEQQALQHYEHVLEEHPHHDRPPAPDQRNPRKHP